MLMAASHRRLISAWSNGLAMKLRLSELMIFRAWLFIRKTSRIERCAVYQGGICQNLTTLV
jgi:hypothetical protein